MNKKQEIEAYILKQFQKIQIFRRALSSESDRGCALLAASFLDNALSDLMYCSFVYDKKIEKDLLNGTAPLATFSSRIDMAYYLGKIPKNCKSDLHIIRRIRNQFGHNPEIISFKTASISDSCKALKFSYHEQDKSPREHFTASVLGILSIIQDSTFTSKAPEEMPDWKPSEEMKAKHRDFLKQISKELFNSQKDSDHENS
nr:MltR family transcriptional regulator [uncultured Desulfobacter sp.]